MTYRAELDGFTGHFNTVAELKAWAEALKAPKGSVCRIYKAVWVAKDGSGAQYVGKPTCEVVVGG
jgi:hypothetical protein